MEKHLDITLDLETASLSSHAAILQIAAVAWDRFAEDADHMFVTKPECSYARKADDTEHFCVRVDLNTQFVEGLWDFSQSTSEWWRGQSDAAKHAVVGYADITQGCTKIRTNAFCKTIPELPLNSALVEMSEWVKRMTLRCETREPNFWCQGTDFDIPILRYAAECCNLSSLIPKHKFFRDCRTAIYENTAAWLGHPDCEQPYSRLDLLNDPLLAYRILPDLPESFGTRENAHGALYDCIRSSWFTWQALRLTR